MEQTSLIHELNQGKELAKQLRNHLQPSASQTDGILLIEKILGSYEKVLSFLGTVAFEEEAAKSTATMPLPKDTLVSKKRKVMAKWSEQVKVYSGNGPDGSIDDGHSWRKYGQKDILGSKYPRSYFRCSHRFTQGCLATKQVQKSDKDETIHEIIYRGQHTCNCSSRVLQYPTPTAEEAFQKQQPLPLKQEQSTPLQLQHQPSSFDFKEVLVKSESSDGNVDSGSGGLFRLWTESSVVREDQSPFRENEFGCGLSPAFELDDLSGFCSDQTWGAETGFISASNSVSNISIRDLEEYYTFDNLELFC